MLRIFALCIGLFISSCAPHGAGTYFTSGTRDYAGDGKISDTSQSSGAVQTRGYLVELPHFPLDRPYENTFDLDGLPTIDGKLVEIAFLVPETFSKSNPANIKSRVEFVLLTADNKEITSHKSALGDLIWSSPVHGHPGHALYEIKNSFFQPISSERYRLHIVYSPAAGAGSGDGYFYLWSGIGGS